MKKYVAKEVFSSSFGYGSRIEAKAAGDPVESENPDHIKLLLADGLIEEVEDED